MQGSRHDEDRARAQAGRRRIPRGAALGLAGLLAVAAMAMPTAAAAERYYVSDNAPVGAQKGIVVTFHGGGWLGDPGPYADVEAGQLISQYTSFGYRTFNVGYRTGHSVKDATDAYDAIRTARPHAPICTAGISAGAQLALAVAWRRDVDCVIAISGPSDLIDWGGRPGSAAGEQYATDAFAGRRARLSPVNRVDQLTQPVLIAAARCDQLIAYDQQEEFAKSLERGALVTMDAGGSGYGLAHCTGYTTTYALEDRSRAILARAGRRG